MRHWRTLIVLLIMSAMVLSGCLQVPDSPDEDAENNDVSPDEPTDPEDDALSPEGDNGRPGDDPRDDPGDNGDEPGDDGRRGNGTGDQDLECHERNPPGAAEPVNHSVDSVGDIECAGQFAITNDGSGESWAAPGWNVGDWWTYEINTSTVGFSDCKQEKREVIDISGSVKGVPVYTLEVQAMDCDGEPKGNPTQQNKTQDSFVRIDDDGYIEHYAIFPLVEGKSWVFMNRAGDNLKVGPAEHDASYSTGLGSSVEAWHVEWEMSDGDIEYRHSWAPDVKNLLEEELKITSSGITIKMETELIDSSYELEEDNGILPGLPKL